MAKENNDTLLKKIDKEFKLTTLALNNRNTILLLALAILGFGIFSYRTLPKELMPEVVIPTIMVQAPYPGNPPIDIENLITRPLEKEIESVDGIEELNSTSSQGFSLILVEFNTDVNIDKALQDVKDAVDKAERDLPEDLQNDPSVQDIDFSEFPIININLSGNYSIDALNDYGEYFEDEIEEINQISSVDIQGVNEKEVKVDVDPYRMEATGLSFREIESAIQNENVTIPGGELRFNRSKRSIRTEGEFEEVAELRNIIVQDNDDKLVYLKDIADVRMAYAYPDSYTRLDQDPVISLQVIKKSGENLLAATNQIFDILDRARENQEVPEDLRITITNDQSDMIRNQLNNLENSIILGVIFVVLVLYYFLGTKNALFVGTAIPMSMFLSFIVLTLMEGRINMIVLFSLILALGLLVDNAIVVVENIYRFVHDRGYKPYDGARQAVGEIALPIITSTVTTLSAFLPLAFWGGITGEFMKNLPITLIIVLTSSLFVALVIIPVLAATFIKYGKMRNDGRIDKRKNYRIVAVFAAIAGIFYLVGVYSVANILLILVLIVFLNALIFHRAQYLFQNVFLERLENGYLKLLEYALYKKNPVKFFAGTIFALILVIVFLGLRQPDILFFPDNDPDYINVRAELPVGTDIQATDSVMHIVEEDIIEYFEPHSKVVESVLTTVGSGAGEGITAGGTPNIGLTTISFVDYELRGGVNTSDIMAGLSDQLIGEYPGVQISLEKNQMGPPTGNPINLEISGEDFNRLILLTDSIRQRIEQSNVPGIEGLKMDLDVGKPEVLVDIDRENARRFGLSTMQIANQIRTSIFGRDISDFKVGEDEYPIQLRMQEPQRYDLSTLMNQKLTLLNNEEVVNIPISSVADVEYSTTYGAVKRKDLDRVITLYSNVMEGYNANEINNQLKTILANYDMPEGYNYEFTGEQEEQQESMDFLIRALIIAAVLIMIILVTQFNSLIKPLIIISSVIFSTIGVFLGIGIFNMDIVVVMTGIGVVSLAGIVVNNAIVLVDYIELLKKRKRRELGLEEESYLPAREATECVVQGGKTRLRPVLLTAITTILGLLPLAIGLNMDFGTLLSEFDPQIYFGGNMANFWGPISWTVIFGLTFATFLTLVIVPVMYRISIVIQKRLLKLFNMEHKVADVSDQ
ncbi:MAG: efflux RND transporter permease subunit [Bacteroidota bacterium]